MSLSQHLGLCGSHRTGKTTLAREMSVQFDNVEAHLITTAGVFQQLGMDPAKHYTFAERMDVQFKILENARTQWQIGRDRGHRYSVSDRTPLDMLAYTLADVTNSAECSGAVLEQHVENYTRACFDATEEFFDALIFVPIAIPVQVDPAKSSASTFVPYMQHISHLVYSLLTQTPVATFYLPHQSVRISDRLDYLAAVARR